MSKATASGALGLAFASALGWLCCLPIASGAFGIALAALVAAVGPWWPVLATASLVLLVVALVQAVREGGSASSDRCDMRSHTRKNADRAYTLLVIVAVLPVQILVKVLVLSLQIVVLGVVLTVQVAMQATMLGPGHAAMMRRIVLGLELFVARLMLVVQHIVPFPVLGVEVAMDLPVLVMG